MQLVRALARLDDLAIDVVTTDRECQAPTRCEWEGATIHRLPWEGRQVLRHALGPGRRRVRAYIKGLKPDVIHAHDFYGLMVKGMPVPRGVHDPRVHLRRHPCLRAAFRLAPVEALGTG